MSDCPTDNDFDGRIGVRISSIFVILVGSFLGTWFPVFAARHQAVGVPSWAFFIAKYFGSGVILATAFIHVSNPGPGRFLFETDDFISFWHQQMKH